MVKFFSILGKEAKGMHQAAYLLALFALCSQILALTRDHLLAREFGATHTLDLYYAAFRIPDFLFATIASLLSLYALLPVLSKLEEKKTGQMVAFLRQILLLFFITMGVVSAVVYLFVPTLLHLMTPGLVSPELILLTRILLLQPIFLGASNIVASMTQLRSRFFLYSISPLLYNLGIIVGILWLYPIMGLAGLAWGVVIGAVLHGLMQVPFFVTEKSAPSLPLRHLFKEVYSVLLLSIPRTLALSAGQISILALIGLASALSSGSISIFMLAYNLQAVPLTIIGVSYSVAAFPTLARLHAAGKKDEFMRYISTALRHIFFWSIPATIFIIVLRAQLVRVILGAGAFDWGATRLTAAALALFVLSLAAQSAFLLIARSYYAAGNTHKPLYFGILDVFVSITSASALSALFHWSPFARAFVESLLRVADVPGSTVLMLALGYALGSITKFWVSFISFRRDFALTEERLGHLVFQSFSAAMIGASTTYIILRLTGIAGEVNTTFGLVLQGLGSAMVGLAVWGLTLRLLKNTELAEAITILHQKMRKTTVPPMEATEVS